MNGDDLPFIGRALLAPMEGVTEPCFRDLVLERNVGSTPGGAFTEFARVVDRTLPAGTLTAHMGPRRQDAPVGLQLMGQSVDDVAATAALAERLGAPLVDLNFGCPAKGALRTCAGSALLDDPPRVRELVRACVEAVRSIPITAKIRAGGKDDSRLEEIAEAVEAGGARLLTVHCRTRDEGYRGGGDWSRLRRAVRAVSIPVCGNGGVDSHADLHRLLEETGCSYVMVGRAALENPWIFDGRDVGPDEALQFLLDYGRLLSERGGACATKVAGRLKQLIRRWTPGGLFDANRDWWLRQSDPMRHLEALRPDRMRRRSAC